MIVLGLFLSLGADGVAVSLFILFLINKISYLNLQVIYFLYNFGYVFHTIIGVVKFRK